MKKIGFAIAALGAIALAAPTIANAETVVIKHGHPHYWHRSHAEVIVRRGWHPHHDRTVIIRHGHGYHHHW